MVCRDESVKKGQAAKGLPLSSHFFVGGIETSSLSPTSHSMDTPRAFARTRSSASQTWRWFFSMREMISFVISTSPMSWIFRARSSWVMGGDCSALPILTAQNRDSPV